MHKARYWLLLKVAEMPKAFTYGAGILVACVLMFATMVATVWLDQSRISQRHAEALHLFEVITSESTELLAHLAGYHELSCNNEELIQLNTHLLESRYIREIGLMDDDRRLICSTALGRLAQPIKGDYPVHVSRSGLELIAAVPLMMADKKLAAMIILNPPFNVVISPYVTGDIYARADAVWLRTAGSLVLLDATAQPDAITDMRTRAERHERSDFALRGLGYELITMDPGLDTVLQTQRRLGTIVQENSLLLPALLAGSLLIAVLAVGTLTPYVMRLRNLRNRIGFLCDEAHLTLVYQPLFDLTTMRPVGCEVLARLKEGGKSWTPDKIIPAIQSASLEYQFDRAVTRKAIRELAKHLPAWSGKFGLALNYFPESVGPDKLVPMLNEALGATGRHDLEICVEITEHSLSNEVISEVRALKAQGFLVAVDDFGTGYSNLKSVTQLSPDLLKIDRSFVYELEDATVRSNLIAEIVNIAHAVNAETVAEGIETLEQARLLAAAGVRYGQGYALARPMEMPQFIAWVARFK